MLNKPQIFSIPRQQAIDHYRVNYQKRYLLQKKFNSDSIVVDMENYYLELRHELTELLLAKKIIPKRIPLERLHEYIGDDLKRYGNDGLGAVGTFLYENNEVFVTALRKFIHNVLYKKVFQQPFLFQKTPTFRIHCPNAENSAFFPHYHTDLALGHPPWEINLWLPLTPPVQSHGFYLASLDDSTAIAEYLNFDLFSVMDDAVFRDGDYLKFCEEKFLPVNVATGNALIFDGRCFHTAMPIQTHTRISVDFRIVLEEDFNNAEYIYQNCGRRKQLLMVPDEYYYGKNSAEVW
jgi:hypothetical protein